MRPRRNAWPIGATPGNASSRKRGAATAAGRGFTGARRPVVAAAAVPAAAARPRAATAFRAAASARTGRPRHDPRNAHAAAELARGLRSDRLLLPLDRRHLLGRDALL